MLNDGWSSRRGGHASGLLTKKHNNAIYIGRKCDDNKTNEIALSKIFKIADLKYFYLSFLARSDFGYSGQDRVEIYLSFLEEKDQNDPFFSNNEKVLSFKNDVQLKKNKDIFVSWVLDIPKGFNYVKVSIRTRKFSTEISEKDGIWIKNLRVVSSNNLSLMTAFYGCSDLRFSAVTTPEWKWIGNENEKVIIAFASVNFPRGKYQLSHVLNNYRASKFYINDSQSEWYSTGVVGLGSCRQEIISNVMIFFFMFFQEKTVITIGLSMGAYGAILFGSKWNANAILAFNPELKLYLEGSRSLSFAKTQDQKYSSIIDLASNNVALHLLYSNNDIFDCSQKALILKCRGCTSLYEINSEHNIGWMFESYSWVHDFIESAIKNKNYTSKFIKRFDF